MLDSVRETIRIGEEGGLPTQITHHKIIGQAELGQERGDAEAGGRGARARRGRDHRSVSLHGVEHRHRGAVSAVGAGGRRRSRPPSGSRAPDQRARIKATIVENLKLDRGAGDPKNVAIVNCAFDRTLAGKNLAEITHARGVEPTIENAAETAIDLLLEGRLLGDLSRHRRGRRGAHHAARRTR